MAQPASDPDFHHLAIPHWCGTDKKPAMPISTQVVVACGCRLEVDLVVMSI
jgi:hypothetical protein